jgi:hypothetical protein
MHAEPTRAHRDLNATDQTRRGIGRVRAVAVLICHVVEVLCLHHAHSADAVPPYGDFGQALLKGTLSANAKPITKPNAVFRDEISGQDSGNRCRSWPPFYPDPPTDLLPALRIGQRQ